MKKIAIVHPKMNEAGGSEARPMWLMQALQEEYDVTFVTMGEFDLEKFNSIHGTSVDPKRVRIVTLPIPRFFRKRFDAYRDIPLHRYVKRHRDDYDLFVSTYNVMDFGKPGIQCIADFSFDDGIRREVDGDGTGTASLARKMYIGLSALLKGIKETGWKRNVTVVNSDWSGRIMKERFGVESVTVYPAVRTTFPGVEWRARRTGFVSLGRISSEKKQDTIVSILKGVRQYMAVNLSIVGPVPDTPYAQELKNLAMENAAWVHLVGGLFGDEKVVFLPMFRYAIHGRTNEAFGIAVAELVKAGCIVWVPDGGGQTEIVDHPLLTYRDEADAVEKIVRVLGDERLQEELCGHLAQRAEIFSAETFMVQMRHIIDAFFLQEENVAHAQ